MKPLLSTIKQKLTRHSITKMIYLGKRKDYNPVYADMHELNWTKLEEVIYKREEVSGRHCNNCRTLSSSYRVLMITKYESSLHKQYLLLQALQISVQVKVSGINVINYL